MMELIKRLLWTDRFIGVQGLFSALIGMFVVWVAGLANIFFLDPDATGILISSGLLMVFIRKSLVKNPLFWLVVAMFCAVNLAGLLWLKPNPNPPPGFYAPFLLIELICFWFLTAKLFSVA